MILGLSKPILRFRACWTYIHVNFFQVWSLLDIYTCKPIFRFGAWHDTTLGRLADRRAVPLRASCLAFGPRHGPRASFCVVPAYDPSNRQQLIFINIFTKILKYFIIFTNYSSFSPITIYIYIYIYCYIYIYRERERKRESFLYSHEYVLPPGVNLLQSLHPLALIRN